MAAEGELAGMHLASELQRVICELYLASLQSVINSDPLSLALCNFHLHVPIISPASQPAPPARVRMEILQQNRVMLMQAINLPALLPVLVRHGVFTPEETDRLRDEHHTSVERLTFLLQYISRKGQSTVDEFVQCLREETRHRGHQEILQLLEKSASDRPEFSPVLAILDAQLEVIVKHLDVNSIAQLLADADVIPRHNVMDVTNPQKTPQEQLSRLIRVVQSQGVQGMVGFLRCLQEDLRSTSHQKLAQILLEQGSYNYHLC